MTFKIYKYKAYDNPHMLKPNRMTAWMSEEDWNRFLSEYPAYRNKDKKFYVRIECHRELSDFSIFASLGTIHSPENIGNGFIWLANEIMPINDCTTNKQTEVDVTVVDATDIPVAESLTINMNEDDVAKWSDEEFEKATVLFKRHVKLCNIQQKIFFNPETKDSVVIKLSDVYPSPVSEQAPFWISDRTDIILKGKPVNRQQTIDFSKIGGQQKVIDELRRIIQLPMNYPDYFEKFNIAPPKGVLLYGPPGNGKTMIARAVAQSFGASFVEIDLTDALQKYKGVGEYNLGQKFEEAEKKKNAVIFIDEIDSIASIREIDSAKHEVSLVGKLLSLMDGIKSSHRVFVIGATNRLYAIDPALRRPGRFDKELEVPMPDCNARLDILYKYVKLDTKNVFDSKIDEEYLKYLSKQLEGYSGADISALYTEAAMSAINRQLSIDKDGKATMLKDSSEILITQDDFQQAQKAIKTTKQRLGESGKSHDSKQ